MLDDFIDNRFLAPDKIYYPGEKSPVDENGIPMSFT